jgi:hypothetical protein
MGDSPVSGGERLSRIFWQQVSAMPGKRIDLDRETYRALELLAADRMANFQDLADEAFSDLLRKHNRPVGLKAALKQSAGQREVVALRRSKSKKRRGK